MGYQSVSRLLEGRPAAGLLSIALSFFSVCFDGHRVRQWPGYNYSVFVFGDAGRDLAMGREVPARTAALKRHRMALGMSRTAAIDKRGPSMKQLALDPSHSHPQSGISKLKPLNWRTDAP